MRTLEFILLYVMFRRVSIFQTHITKHCFLRSPCMTSRVRLFVEHSCKINCDYCHCVTVSWSVMNLIK